MSHRGVRPAWKAISYTGSSAVAMRSVADALRGRFIDVWEIEAWKNFLLRSVSVFGKHATRFAAKQLILNSIVEPVWAERIMANDLASWAVSLYEDLNWPWNAIIVGSPAGGVAHLALAMGVPFLSQSFSSNYRCSVPVDDVRAYQAFGERLSGQITSRNSDLAVINHYDPLHDRLAIKHCNRIRYKLLDLPVAYRSFIMNYVRPGGTIFFSNCRYAWPSYFTGERQWFQVGGLGSVNPWAFIQGRPEFAELQAKTGHNHWGLGDRMAFDLPEAEWGTQPPLRETVKQFADQYGYRFVGLEAGHPRDFSVMAFDVWKRLFEDAGIEPQGVLIETGTQVAPLAARLGRLLPLWLPGSYKDSVTFLRDMTTQFPEDKPVVWLPQPDFAPSFDSATWEQWLEPLAGKAVLPMGARRRSYPQDPAALLSGREEIMQWVSKNLAEIPNTLAPGKLVEEAIAARLRP
ncbi:MAG: hypothetical protein JW981_10740 [Anaerolineae bacterium]|nr:hypothetical protein [Anaerolineae bacterium]